MGHLVSLSPSSWCILVVHHVRIVSMCYHLTSQRYTRVQIITRVHSVPLPRAGITQLLSLHAYIRFLLHFVLLFFLFFFLSLFSSSYLTVLVTIKLWYWFTELLRFILRGAFQRLCSLWQVNFNNFLQNFTFE